MFDGCNVGFSEGMFDGCNVGLSEGTCDGRNVGLTEGSVDGCIVGLSEGTADGTEDGASDGHVFPLFVIVFPLFVPPFLSDLLEHFLELLLLGLSIPFSCISCSHCNRLQFLKEIKV